MAATQKTDKFDTVEAAIAGAGTTQLSHLGGGTAGIQTVDQVKEYEEENNLTGPPVEGAHRAYAGPYTDMEDQRNAWTAAQDSGDTSRTKDAVPAATEETPEQKKQREQREQQTRQPSKEPVKEPAKEPVRHSAPEKK